MATRDAVVPTTPHQDGPTALVAQGHAVIRIENETLAQVALQRPRDEAKVLNKALKELELVPEEASKAYYEIPYRDTAPGGEQKMVKVTGPSIRAAAALARCWGNCSATARILNEDEEGVDLEGVFIDFESSVRFTRPQRASKWMKTRRGMVLLDGKRLEAAIGSAGSKAMRNAILTGLPAYLVAAYDKRAREIAGGKAEAKLDAKVVASIVKAFAEFKVEQGQLEGYLEKSAAEWTGADRASLIGVYNALKDGQTTVEDVFGGTQPETPAAAETGPTTVTPESLMGGTVTGKDGQEPGAPTAPEPEQPTLPTDSGPDREALLGKVKGRLAKLRQHEPAGIDLWSATQLADFLASLPEKG